MASECVYPSIQASFQLLLASRHPVFFHLYNYSIRSSNCSVIFLWWFTNMVFKDYLYFQINKFMEKRAWPVLFLFLTTILQKSTLKISGWPNGHQHHLGYQRVCPDPSFYQLCFIASQGRADYLPGELLCSLLQSPLLWGKQPPPFSTLPLPRMPLLLFPSSSPHSLANIQWTSDLH